MQTAFEREKTITELGIDTSRKFIVLKENPSYYDKGEIVTLASDDNTFIPSFRKEDGNTIFISLKNLAYYNEEELKEYIVYVSNGRTPERMHTLESAKKEAKRLAKLEKKDTYIYKQVAKYGIEIKETLY